MMMSPETETQQKPTIEVVGYGSEPLILSSMDLIHPSGRRFWLDDSMFDKDPKTGLEIPHFSVQEVAKCFFGKGADWLRWRSRPDKERDVRCPHCKGTGKVQIEEKKRPGTCSNCKGRGRTTIPQQYPHGYFLLDGKPLEFKRLPSGVKCSKCKGTGQLKTRQCSACDGVGKVIDPDAHTARYYTLADIERMAHALAQQGIIDGTRLAHTILMAKVNARLYGVI
jgi:hypothetical protein